MTTSTERVMRHRAVAAFARDNGLERVPTEWVTLVDTETGNMVTFNAVTGERLTWVQAEL